MSTKGLAGEYSFLCIGLTRGRTRAWALPPARQCRSRRALRASHLRPASRLAATLGQPPTFAMRALPLSQVLPKGVLVPDFQAVLARFILYATVELLARDSRNKGLSGLSSTKNGTFWDYR